MKGKSTPEFCVHVGLPKTASTYLQRLVFPGLEGIHFIKKHDFGKRREIIARTGHSKYLLSDEGIIKDNTVGRIDDDRRLREISDEMPDAKIILMFRRHDRWVMSKYRYYLRKNGHESFDRYFDPAHNRGVLPLEECVFMRDIRVVEKYFRRRPLVLFQEEVLEHPGEAVRLLADFMGAVFPGEKLAVRIVNPAFTDKQLKVIRAFNRAIKHRKSRNRFRTVRVARENLRRISLHTVGFLARGVPGFVLPGQPLIPPESAARIRERFAEDWRSCLDYAGADRDLLLGPESR